jgi:branched-chain amino acid transport system permease protein
MIVALGLNFLTGYAGQISVGHGALVAIGAYALAIAETSGGLSFWSSAVIAMTAASGIGALMALPALRLSNWYFALVTLFFAQVVSDLLAEMTWLTGGFTGIAGIPAPALFGHELGDEGMYVLVVGTVIVSFALLRNLVHSRLGRAMVAARDNPLSAAASGIPLVRVKLIAFIISAALAGLAGAIFAAQKTVISTDDFGAEFSIFFLLIIVVGGEGRLLGPIAGALIFFLVPELLGALATWRVLVYGVALLALMLFAPHGVVGALEDRWRRRPRAGRPPSRVSLARAEGASLEIAGLWKGFGGVIALDSVNLNVPAGSVHGLVGPNGSGKTTLLNMISGFYPVDAGSVRLGQVDLTGRRAHRIARLGVGRTFQTPKLLGQMSLLDNVLLGAYAEERVNLIDVALRLPRSRHEAAGFRDIAMHLLDFVGLADRADDRAGAIPHGQQRLLEVARTLVSRPRLLLLDEPAAGLSMRELETLGVLIRAISALGSTILIVEHHLELIADVCQSVTVLNRGRILFAGTPAEAFAHPEVVDAYMGRARTGAHA